MRIRRSSTIGPGSFQNPFGSVSASRLRSMQTAQSDDDNESPSGRWDEAVPLLGDATRRPGSQAGVPSYGASDTRMSRNRSRRTSSASSRARLRTAFSAKDKYDVNHPPSIPGSPTFGPTDGMDMNFGDVMMRDELTMSGDEALSETEGADHRPDHERRLAPQASGDVCFPGPGMSDIGEDEIPNRYETHRYSRTRRRRGRWPDLSVLEDWMRYEKEDRSDERRVKKITEPQLINGRLRPVRKGWYQTEEEAPYRFTYFNEEFQSTIHSQTISELVQQGSDFQGLFIPEPRILSSDEESESEDIMSQPSKPRYSAEGLEADTKPPTRQPSFDNRREGFMSPPARDETNTSSRSASIRGSNKSPDHLAPKDNHNSVPKISEKPVRYGERPVWWLDILSPTEDEMKVLAKAFGIHPLTAEDVMLQEAREKVELFRHYYFVNYRTFDQDINSENFLEPVNMYVIVFREGVLSFHFSITPHPANVRRRIRQLRDYLILSSDWISYAIIDDITDVFQPLIQNIEDEVDEIDEVILKLHTSTDKRLQDEKDTRHDDNTTIVDSSGDMLRRVGDCRKRVMSLYRLLGNKADVIKGFAKRCNERWEVAPRSEIGLYLGDIQDHIVTMTSNLSHYEKCVPFSYEHGSL